MEYAGPDNRPHRPVMLHRVRMGSAERFVGGLIEHYAGAFPVWLAPVQVCVLPVTQAHEAAAEALRDELRAAGLRPELARADETLGRRMRQVRAQKVPYAAVIGDREAGAGTVALRRRGAEKEVAVIPRGELIARLCAEAESRAVWGA